MTQTIITQNDILKYFIEEKNINKLKQGNINETYGIRCDVPENQIIINQECTGKLQYFYGRIFNNLQSIIINPEIVSQCPKMKSKSVLMEWKLFHGIKIDMAKLHINKNGFPIDKLYSIKLFLGGIEYGFANSSDLEDCGEYYKCNLFRTQSAILDWITVYHQGGFIFYFHPNTKNDEINIDATIGVEEILEKNNLVYDTKTVFKLKTYTNDTTFLQSQGMICSTEYIDYKQYKCNVDVPKDLKIVIDITKEKITENSFEIRNNEIVRK